MEARASKLEDVNVQVLDRLGRIETRIDALATKADLAEVKSGLLQVIDAQTWKFVTWTTGVSTAMSSGLVAATYFIAHR